MVTKKVFTNKILLIIVFIVFAVESGNNRIGTFDMVLYLKTVYKDIDWDSYDKNTAECEKMRVKYNQLKATIDSLKRNKNTDTIKFMDTIKMLCDNWEIVSNKCKPSKLSNDIYNKYGPYMFNILDTLYLQVCKKYSLDIIVDKIDLNKLYPMVIDNSEYEKLPNGMLKGKHFFSEQIRYPVVDTANKYCIDVTGYMIKKGLKLQRKIKNRNRN